MPSYSKNASCKVYYFILQMVLMIKEYPTFFDFSAFVKAENIVKIF